MEVSSFQSNEVWKEIKILHHQFGLVWSQTPVSDGKESKTQVLSLGTLPTKCSESPRLISVILLQRSRISCLGQEMIDVQL